MKYTLSFTLLRLSAFLAGVMSPLIFLFLYVQQNVVLQPFLLIGFPLVSLFTGLLLHVTRYRHYSLSYIDRMSGEQFELYARAYFSHRGYRHIRTTKTTRDFGADILMKKGFHSIVVQAKRYDRNIGVHAIQQVLASKAYYHCSRAIVVTNQYFTPSARQLAEVNEVELIDRDQLGF